MNSVSGTPPLGVQEHGYVASSDSAPPSSKPIAVSEVKPDVSVAISEMAQARMESMAAPADASQRAGLSENTSNGSLEFGVDKGGFDWPLNAEDGNTAEASKFESQNGWEAQGKVTNGILESDANEADYIALGKSTVAASN